MGLRAGFTYMAMACFILLVASCDMIKKPKSNIEITFTQDTLDVGYTYWWPQSGPFIGDCGEGLSLVFSGIVTQLGEPTDDAGPLYTSQKGIVSIEKALKIKELNDNTYANQKFFRSDCFHGLGLSVGDTVLVVCYDYDGDYSIPGKKSILKVTSFEDPIIKSIKKYIDSDQDPIKLKRDTSVWRTVGLDKDLKQIMACRSQTDVDTLDHNEQ